jgi:hypothetical protein
MDTPDGSAKPWKDVKNIEKSIKRKSGYKKKTGRQYVWV